MSNPEFVDTSRSFPRAGTSNVITNLEEWPLLQAGRYRCERRRERRTNSRNRSNDDDRNERSNESVFNCRRARLVLDEFLNRSHFTLPPGGLCAETRPRGAS